MGVRGTISKNLEPGLFFLPIPILGLEEKGMHGDHQSWTLPWLLGRISHSIWKAEVTCLRLGNQIRTLCKKKVTELAIICLNPD